MGDIFHFKAWCKISLVSSYLQTENINTTIKIFHLSQMRPCRNFLLCVELSAAFIRSTGRHPKSTLALFEVKWHHLCERQKWGSRKDHRGRSGMTRRRRNWQIDKPVTLVVYHQQHILLNWLFKIMPCLIVFRFTLPRSLVQGFRTIFKWLPVRTEKCVSFQVGAMLVVCPPHLWEQCWAVEDSWSGITLQQLCSTAC